LNFKHLDHCIDPAVTETTSTLYYSFKLIQDRSQR
jgi:hypothetical protein